MICLVDERISEKCVRGLILQGFRPIKLPRSERLGAAVASHPDMLLFAHGKRIIASADYCERYPWVFSDIRELSDAELCFTDDVFGESYPDDVCFNALVAGGHVFFKEDAISSAVKEYARAAGLIPVPTGQGYPACTVLAFGNSAITADRGMARHLSDAGISVTLIENGDISLPPYEYGFIGGAAGVFGDKVYFLGDVSLHRDSERIISAILREGYTPVSLSDEPLVDLGRIIFIQ